jgi:uncharacterized membrane protein
MPLKSSTMTTINIILILTATTTALVAGLLYAYSCSVNPGLSKLSDEGYVAAMQSINRAIQNPLFFASFMGTLVLLPLSTWMGYRTHHSTYFFLLLSASIIYLIGVFGVTVLGNIPLNQALDQFTLQQASAKDITDHRVLFELPWNKFHSIRTLSAVAALVLVIVACVNRPVSHD